MAARIVSSGVIAVVLVLAAFVMSGSVSVGIVLAVVAGLLAAAVLIALAGRVRGR